MSNKRPCISNIELGLFGSGGENGSPSSADTSCSALIDRPSIFWVIRWKDSADGATNLSLSGTHSFARTLCAGFGSASRALLLLRGPGKHSVGQHT